MTPNLTNEPTDLIIRPARSEDKAAVLAFTQNTFHWGDYIDWVWDDWIADPQGSMIVAFVFSVVKTTQTGSPPAPPVPRCRR